MVRGGMSRAVWSDSPCHMHGRRHVVLYWARTHRIDCTLIIAVFNEWLAVPSCFGYLDHQFHGSMLGLIYNRLRT